MPSGHHDCGSIGMDRNDSTRRRGEACKLYIVTAGERQGNGYSAELGEVPGGKFAAGYWALHESESGKRIANGAVKKLAELLAMCALSK